MVPRRSDRQGPGKASRSRERICPFWRFAPSVSAPEEEGRRFCYGLRDQVGVLWDGTVVPCCLDHEGDVPLGNLYETSLEEILSGPRAEAIYQGFSQGEAREDLCRRCAFTRRFQ